MNKACLIILLVLLLSPLSTWAQTGELVNVLALGQAPLREGEAGAREQAVKDALRLAVTQVVVGMVDSTTLVDKLAQLKNEVLDKASSFVASFSLRTTKVDQGVIMALVSVSVNRGALNEALTQSGLRLASARLAETLVLVSEEASPGRPPVYWWSGVAGMPAAPAPVARVLEALGVKISDPAALLGNISSEARQPVINEIQAVALAKQAGAGLVLMGRVRTYPLIGGTGEETPPLAQLQILDAVQGKVLALEEEAGPKFSQMSGTQAAQEVDQAIQGAVRRVLEKVSLAGNATPAGQGEMTLTISGVRSLADLNRFEEVLGSLTSMVGDMSRESAGADWASLRLNLKVSPSQLADQLLLQDFGRFLVNVVEMGPQSMKLVMIPR